MTPVGSGNVELVAVAGAGVRHEQFPIADAAHPHRMSQRIPEIEIADHADGLGVRRQHHERDAVHAIERHRMRAELLVDPPVGAFAQQIEIEVAEHGREAVGIVEIDDVFAEAGTELVAFGAVRQRACKQPGIVNPLQRRRLAVLVDRLHVGGFGDESAHHAVAALAMQAEIAKRIGMLAFDNCIGLGGQLGHEASNGGCDNVRMIPVRGMRSQSGRYNNSYSISFRAFSSRKKVSMPSAALESVGHSR